MKKHAHFYAIGAAPIDENEGTIRLVSLIRLGNAEGHFDDKGRQEVVDELTLKQVYAYCKSAGTIKVKADHGSGVFSTIGWVDDFSLTDEQVLANFHVYETEESRSKLFEIAKKNPDHMGLSLEFEGKNSVKGDKTFARCEKILAVALVSDPAANKSLFSANPTEQDDQQTNQQNKDMADNEQTPSAEDRIQELTKKFEEYTQAMEARFQKLENPEVVGDDDGDADADKPKETPATDPAEQPDKDSAGKTYVNPDAEIDDEETKKIEMAAQRGAEKAVKIFAASIGVNLAKPGTGGSTTQVKTYQDIINDEAKNFDNNKVAAEAHILRNLGTHPEWKKAYEAHRPVKTS